MAVLRPMSSVEQQQLNEGPTEAVLGAVESEFRTALGGLQNGNDLDALQSLRSQFFGPKGKLTLLLRSVGKLPPKERRGAGQATNQLKQRLEGELTTLVDKLEAAAKEAELRKGRLDMTLPGRRNRPQGGVHPVNRVIQDMVEIFHRMGFSVAKGPEVELDFYNFEALNFPSDHPARDMQDTFFVRPPDGRAIGDLVLRTHTSPVQIRSMEAQGAPIRIVSPGRVYRVDEDKTHSPMFHQIEALWVDEGVSVAHLKGVLKSFINAAFGEREMRLRPSFFPFVEPGMEVDIECVFCDGAGTIQGDTCKICKGTGWVEILGAGMVHPNVLEACKIDSEKYTGFAFGLGIDRVAMLRWAINGLGHMFSGDARVLGQL